MRLFKSSRYRVIDAVLTLLLDASDGPPQLVVEPYKNGREQGYLLTDYHHAAVLTEDRSSDAICLYTGTTRDFESAGNLPRRETYIAGRSWGSGEAGTVARAIVDFFKQVPTPPIDLSDDGMIEITALHLAPVPPDQLGDVPDPIVTQVEQTGGLPG